MFKESRCQVYLPQGLASFVVVGEASQDGGCCAAGLLLKYACLLDASAGKRDGEPELSEFSDPRAGQVKQDADGCRMFRELRLLYITSLVQRCYKMIM